ncbi:MAG: ABC transporter permease [Sedimentisphaerales bacterium]|nr:ABC transporter permease [Sedimentisphaerales bacterium]
MKSTIRLGLMQYLGLTLALMLLVIFFSLFTQHFFSLTTFNTIAGQIPDITIIAVGMTFVLIIGGIDLSVGSVMALSGAVLGFCLVSWHWPLPLSIAACILTGLICGLFNGSVSIVWKLPSFIMTLGMLQIARGGAYLITDSRTVYIGAPIEGIADARLAGISVSFFLAVALVVLGQIVLTRSVFGRYLIGIGANEEAVRLSGIDPRPRKLVVFALSGVMCGVAAVLQTARLSSANPNAGIGMELSAIAAVVIGGTSLMGGRGSVIGTFFGVLIIAVLDAGLAQMNAPEPSKRLITGCVIIIAAIIDHYRVRLSRGNA